MEVIAFRQHVIHFFQENGRAFPWRTTSDPYAITVSEFMLQQTQTERVLPKYEEFLRQLPTWQALAVADVALVLHLWQGLGYNRRALALQRTAQRVVGDFGGSVPREVATLETLPGIGPYTARAIAVFAFQEPVVMIETNIRRVYLHHFFPDREDVSDVELQPLIAETLDTEQPRVWYYALMDYGAWLARQVPNPNRRSRHYSKQSKFVGSNRQLRGEVLRRFLRGSLPPLQALAEELGVEPARVELCFVTLQKEGFPLPERS